MASAVSFGSTSIVLVSWLLPSVSDCLEEWHVRSIAGRVGALVSRELIPQLQFSHLVLDGSLKPRDAYFSVRIFSQCGLRVVHPRLPLLLVRIVENWASLSTTGLGEKGDLCRAVRKQASPDGGCTLCERTQSLSALSGPYV